MINVYPDQSIIRFYDGTLIYIDEVQYSSDGKTNWEHTFNPESHISTIDGLTLLDGHKYRRVRHSGDTKFQIPSLWVPEDGQSALLRVTDDYIQWKLELDAVWKNLVALDDLKGLQGDQGIPGTGLNINGAGALDIRPDCGETSSTCTTCNNNSSGIKTPSTFMSVGNHKLETIDIVDELTYWHTVDGTNWVQSTNADLGTYVIGWKASAAANANSDGLTVNYKGQVVLFTASPLYNSAGYIFIYADGVWSQLANISTPSGLIKMNNADVLGFLEDKIDNVTIIANANNLEVADNSIDEFKLKLYTFTDGLDQQTGLPIKAKVEDYAGFGLSYYTSTTDNEEDLQVNVNDLISDGLAVNTTIVPVDGEIPNKIEVNVNDLINDNSGLISTTEADTFDDLQVNLGDGLQFSTDLVKKVEVKADELSLEVDANNIHVKDYLTGNDGILASHLNPDTVDTLKGIDLNNTTGIFAKVDNSTIGYDGTGNLEVPLNGITGDKLNDNVADNTKGIVVLNDMLVAKVDNISTQFNGSGEISLIDTYITNLISGTFVSSLNTLQGDIAIAAVADTYINLSIATSGQNINITPSLDTSLLTTNIINPAISGYNFDEIIDDRVALLMKAGTGITLTYDDVLNTLTVASSISAPTSGSVLNLDGVRVDGVNNTFARSDHKHGIDDNALTIAKTFGLQTALDSKIQIDIPYGNATIKSLTGVVIKSPGGNNYKLIVDDAGNIGTVLV